jgi:alkylhydroperoxidase family enzyme
VVQAVYADPASAPVSAEVKAALALIETFTLHPEDLSPDSIATARNAGLTDEAIEHAFDVATMFNLIDRLADAFDFFVADEPWFDQGAKMLLRFGYRFPPFLYPRP